MSKKGATQQAANTYDQSRYIRNRTRALTRHLKKFPNDEAAKAAMKTVGTYRRCKPKAHKKVWTPIKRWYAQVLVEVGRNGNEALTVQKNNAQVRDTRAAD